jgi:hypothetical protein
MAPECSCGGWVCSLSRKALRAPVAAPGTSKYSEPRSQRNGNECMSWNRGVHAIVVAILLLGAVCACDAGASRGWSSCAPPLLTLRIGSSSRHVGSCAGQYQDLGSVKLTMGDTITADIPRTHDLGAVALPQSGAPAIVAVVSRSADGRHERLRAIVPGPAALFVRTPFCSPPNWVNTPSPPAGSAVPWGLCRILHIDVTRD